MAFTIHKNLFFYCQHAIYEFNLNKFVKNLTDNDFKYLSQEFSGGLLELVKQKGAYLNEFMDTVLKSFLKINCLIEVNFLVL